jgi:hypothetical protein
MLFNFFMGAVVVFIIMLIIVWFEK